MMGEGVRTITGRLPVSAPPRSEAPTAIRAEILDIWRTGLFLAHSGSHKLCVSCTRIVCLMLARVSDCKMGRYYCAER